MNPKHIDKVPNERKAIAPYNFVELPEKVVEAEDLLSGERYHLDHHTGRIECTLTTESLLYTRCGWHPDDFAEHGEKAFQELPDEIKNKRASFFINPKTQQPTIPGSSIRGMLRTLVEIVSFSKIDRVSDEHRIFFRAVASNPDKESWGKEYKNHVEPKKVKTGYLKKDREGWYIQPAKTEQGATFAWVRETSLNLSNFKNFNDAQYEPQYISVSYRSVAVDNTDRAKRLFAHNVELSDTYPKKGVLVTSGNMKQKEDSSSQRCNHCVVFAEDKKAAPLRIDDIAIAHYRNALTDFQKESPFNKDWGVLEENRPVFYCPPENGNKVGFFGQSSNFRIPYSPEGNGHATTAVDFIPKIVHNPYVINWNNAPIKFSVILLNSNCLIGILFLSVPLIDIADAIFGWVKQESKEKKLPKYFNKQRAGRVFVTDALCQSSQNVISDESQLLTPKILAEPKPSNFPHYLVQPKADKSELKHYASEPIQETVIRGHKLYWHQGSNPEFKLKRNLDKKKEVSDTQTTKIKPIKKGVTFKFDIHFENLSKVELGALLWVLDIAQDDRYRLKLGMGKPLGLGAIKIEHKLYESDRQKRYTKLFNDDAKDWEKVETLKDNPNYKQCFESYVVKQLNYSGDFKNLCRIQMLLAMLSWPGPQNIEETTRYMEIERDIAKHYIGSPIKRNDKTVNEYKDRPVLPTPLDVMEIQLDCDRPSPASPQDLVTQETQGFLEGQEIDAKIVDIKVQEGNKIKTTITYEIQGSACPAKEEIYKRNISLAINDIVKVCIVKAKGESIRTVKLIQ
ncbi:MAG: TIGR03986 family CRISPR-associated RAMP protein [Potamolinea sp.]